MNHWTIKVKTVVEDLDTGKLKGKTETFLICADTIEEAQSLVVDFYRDMTIDYEIRSISKSQISEYISQK